MSRAFERLPGVTLGARLAAPVPLPHRAVRMLLAVGACCDLGTVNRYLQGAPVRASIAKRLDREIEDRGLLMKLRPSSGGAARGGSHGATAPTAA